eukprot:1161807-Pelagomonas_calceolata.AAC.3
MRRPAGQYKRRYSRNSGEPANSRANWKRTVPTRSPKKRPCAGWTPPPKPERIACTWEAYHMPLQCERVLKCLAESLPHQSTRLPPFKLCPSWWTQLR